MNLEKQRLADGRGQSDDGWIEPLEMADLQDALVASGDVDQSACGFERNARWVFSHHHVQARFHEFAPTSECVTVGDAITAASWRFLRQLIEAAEHAAPVRLRDRRSPRRVQVIDPGQLGVFRLMNDPQMIFAERSRARDRDTWLHACCPDIGPDMPFQHTGLRLRAARICGFANHIS